MNVLFVGSGAGSWQVRGVQIAKALGARAVTDPTAADWTWADVVVLVKHAAERYGADARRSGARIIWDVLDWWQQPEENQTSITDMVATVAAVRKRYHIHTLIGATDAMASDIGGVYIPHHIRPGLTQQSVRDRLEVVAYEGQSKYLGSWRTHLETACARMGLTFLVNPTDLRVADLVVAFRGEKWDGELCRRWKSGVKIVNAIGASRPLLTQDCAANKEIDYGTVITSPDQLVGAIQGYQSMFTRDTVVDICSMMRRPYTVEAIAKRYTDLIRHTRSQAA